jgi:alpha-glucosidase
LLQSGDYVPVAAEGDLLLYRRQGDGNSVMVALNLGDQPVSIAAGRDGTILLSTFLDRECETVADTVNLRGNEGVIIDTSGIYAG